MERKKFVNARVSDDEFCVLSVISTSEGLNQSESIRWLIRQEANRRGLPTGFVRFYPPQPELTEARDGNQP